MLGSDDLVVTTSTLGHPPFRELVEAAAAGGFAGLSIYPGPVYQAALAAGLSAADMRSLLADNGVVVNDVDVLLCSGDPDDAGHGGMGEAGERALFEAGEALGASFINVVIRAPKPIGIAQGAEVFAGVCDRAAQHGLVAHLEFLPMMSVRDPASAWAIVEQAGRARSGVMIDSWHVQRTGTTIDDLRVVPGDRILGIQLSDALPEPMDDVREETLHHRLVPGEGVIELVALSRLFDEVGSPAPRTAEIFSDALLASGSPREIAIRVGDAMRALRARARA
jgi:sugar phosphate isomerase/epimerase